MTGAQKNRHESRHDFLIKEYKRFHRQGNYFTGTAIKGRIDDIGNVVKETNSQTLLDYGCGGAVYYLKHKIHEGWGVPLPTFYDPGNDLYDKKPDGKYDGVICTDVLEHVVEPEEAIKEILNYAKKFVYIAISCQPSKANKKFSDGTPFHISVHPKEWWKERITERIVSDLRVELRFDV